MVARTAPVRLKTVGPILHAPVYDLTVEHGNFIADGLVVHNCDEIDVMTMDILEAALGQPIGRHDCPAHTVLSSTHQNPDGTMTEMLQRAAERGWAVHEWCWRETVAPHGWLPQAEVARQKLLMSDAMWKVEVELQEPAPEGRAIMSDRVEAMFGSGPEVRVEIGEDVVVEEPVDTGVYATGADWAKENDFTEIVTFRVDCDPMRLVAYRRGQRVSWPTMVGWFNERLRDYPGAAAHDATGIGNVVSDYIEHDSHGITMVGRVRHDLFTEYVAGVERREVTAAKLAPLYQQHKFVRNDDLYGSGHPPDGLVACAMAYRASLMARTPVGVAGGGPRQQEAPSTPQATDRGAWVAGADRSGVDRQIADTGLYWPSGR